MKKLKSKNKKKETFKIWDMWCLLKLQEIGKSTMNQWGEACGYNHGYGLAKIIKNNIDKLKITPSPAITRVRRLFEIKEGVIIR